MKLRTKISMIVLLLWAVMAAAIYFGFQRIILNSYLQLEEQYAMDNVERVHAAIEQIENSVNMTVNDWSIWDDTYQFVVDKNEKYIKANLMLSTFVSTDLDMMLFYNAVGKPVYTMAVNPERTKVIALPRGMEDYLAPKSKLMYQPTVMSNVKGIISIPSGILFVAARAIVTSQQEGPVRGTMVAARHLSDKSLKNIQQITRLNVNIQQLDMIKNQPLLSQYNLLISQQQPLIERSERNLKVFDLLQDINGKPVAMIEVNMPRRLYQIGVNTIHYSNLVLLAYSIILTFLLWILLQTLIVKRIERLGKQLINIDSNQKNYPELLETIEDEVSSVASIYHHATHDPLTGLANRNLLYQAFNQRILTIRQPQNKIAIIFIDLDYFKRVNDTLGHEVGDKLLVQMAERLKSSLRKIDLAVRLGGDEFIIMVADLDQDQVKHVVNSLFARLSQPIFVEEHEIYITLSMGISIYPDDSLDIETLIKQSDIALYQAKEVGRNNYQYYSSELSYAIKKAHQEETELQNAIDKKELCLYYQPIYDALTKHIISFEALVRWQHPQKGILTAKDIIPVAEKSGLIYPIGEWVLSTACKQAKTWLEKELLTVPIAVNISTLQTKRTSIKRMVIDALHRTELDPQYLILELTETGFIEVTSHILDELHALREKGIQIAVDDFGAGYSGLGYLKKLPVNTLKIDISIVKNVPVDPDDCAIILAIIGIAHQLRLQVIAEGVETKEQYEFLRDHKVDAVQGNYFSLPLNAVECEAFLASLVEVHA